MHTISASLGLEDLQEVRTYLPPHLRHDLLERSISDLETLLTHSRADLLGMPRKMSKRSVDILEEKLALRGHALNRTKEPYRWSKDIYEADWEAMFSIPWRSHEKKLLSMFRENGNHAIDLDDIPHILARCRYPHFACWNDAFKSAGLNYFLFIVLLNRRDAVQICKRISGD